MRALWVAVGLWAVSQLLSPVPQAATEAVVAAVVTVAVAPRVWAWTAGGAS